MKTILLPIDFSPASHNAAEFAAQLAAQFSAKLILFHAYMMPTPVSEVPYVMATVEDLQKENEAGLQKEADYIQERYKLDTEQVVRIGVASDEVKELTREKNVDLVVMGMKGAGGLDKIIGSTTINTIKKVKTPVLVVPQDASYRLIKDVVYCSDYDYETNPNAFLPLRQIIEKFGARLHILNVEKRHEKVAVEEMAGKSGTEKLFDNVDHEYTTIVSDSVTHGVNEYLQEKPAQLLAMVHHHHSFFERIFSRSQTTAMAYETHIPLLVLQDKE